MRLVRSGRNGPGVSEMGLGSMGMSGGYRHADDAESIATIHAALEADITMLDTGDFDAAGGRWFGNYETPAVISKVGKAKAGQGEPLDMTVYGRKEFPRESAAQRIGIIRKLRGEHGG